MRRHLLLFSCIAVILLAAGAVVLYEIRLASETTKLYSSIQIGMSEGDLHASLGKPQQTKTIRGRVEGPELFVTKYYTGLLDASDFQDMKVQSWNFPFSTIVTVSDPVGGTVACRYRSKNPRWWQKLLGRW